MTGRVIGVDSLEMMDIFLNHGGRLKARRARKTTTAKIETGFPAGAGCGKVGNDKLE